MPPLIGGGAPPGVPKHNLTSAPYNDSLPIFSIQRLRSTPLDRSCQAEDRLCQDGLSFCEEVMVR